MRRNKLIALFAGLSLAFVSSAALAAPSADTLLVAGYDSDQMAVIYGVSNIDQGDEDTASLDCALDGTYVYELESDPGTGTDAEAVVETEVADDGKEATKVAVTGLKKKAATEGDPDEDVEFFVEDDKVRTPGSGVLYGSETTDDADGAEECALTSVKIEPNGNGEINHGTVVSTFAKLLKGGNGCMIRHFAQSEFGKEEPTELNLETADPTLVEQQLEVSLKSFETACAKGKDKKVDDDAESGVKANGKDKAPGLKDKTDKAKGKDGAPGQQKTKNTQDDDSSSD